MLKQGKAFMFTINNYVQADLEVCESLGRDVRVQYYAWQEEIGAQGTPHIQGYVVFKGRMRLKPLKQLMPRAHWENAYGTAEEATAYCTKAETRKPGVQAQVGGVKPMSAQEKGRQEKERWEAAWEAAKAGDYEAIPADIRLRFWRTIKEVRKDHMPTIAPLDGTTGYWIFGRAGAGKSLYARHRWVSLYVKTATKWFDGYQGEHGVLIDDLGKDHKDLGSSLKIWADSYPFIAEVKGGAMKIRPLVLVITSQYQIKEIWPDKETREALDRRFKTIEVIRPGEQPTGVADEYIEVNVSVIQEWAKQIRERAGAAQAPKEPELALEQAKAGRGPGHQNGESPNNEEENE